MIGLLCTEKLRIASLDHVRVFCFRHAKLKAEMGLDERTVAESAE